MTEQTQELNGWLPIESAPKDGTQILLCQGSWGPYLGFFEEDIWLFYDSEVGNEGRQAFFNSWIEGYPPTHWMPLPPTPKDTPS